jgi:hypothetical protein
MQSFSIFKRLQKGKPVVKYAQQLTENSVEIAWSIPQAGIGEKIDLSRFRVQISSDNFTFDIREWPGKHT